MGKSTAVHTLQASSGLCICADDELFFFTQNLPAPTVRGVRGGEPRGAGTPNRSLAGATLHCILSFVLCFQPRGSFLVIGLVE